MNECERQPSKTILNFWPTRLEIIFFRKFFIKVHLWGWEDGSVSKNTGCEVKGG